MPAKAGRDLVVAIFGPTAAGKSRVAAAVAREVGGEVISADSMQVYRGLAVLTDQPHGEDCADVPHHLVATVPLREQYNAARFAAEAAEALREIKARGNLPLLVGGTGLYMRALLGGFSFAGERDRLWSPESQYRVLSFGLDHPREELYRSIESRVDAMLCGGAVAEVREALKGEVSLTAHKAIGFGEIQSYLEGESTLEEAAAAIRQKSRRYAKRQLTWMRKMPDIVRIGLAGGDYDKAAASIIEHIQAVYAV